MHVNYALTDDTHFLDMRYGIKVLCITSSSAKWKLTWRCRVTKPFNYRIP